MKTGYTIEDWRRAFFAIDRNLVNRKRFISSFKLNKASRILEIGCSDGVNLKALDSMGYKDVVGIDISRELLSKIKGYKCICTDACNLGIKTNSFDEIYCKALLHHINNKDVFSEMARVVRPGGLIHILEPWPTFFRKIADFLTLYVLCWVSKTLYYRRIILYFEKDMYFQWLKSCKIALFQAIKDNNLSLVRRHISLFNLYITIQKPDRGIL